MSSSQAVVLAFGSVIVAVGLWGFIADQRGSGPTNEAGAKVLSISVSGPPALVLSAIGILVFLFPFSPWWPDADEAVGVLGEVIDNPSETGDDTNAPAGAATTDITMSEPSADAEAAPSAQAVALPSGSIVACATSTLGSDVFDGELLTYFASNTLDGDLLTAWNADGRGEGERLRYEFSGPVRLLRIEFRNGYAKSTESFQLNHRLDQIDVLTETGSHSFELADSPEPQVIEAEFGLTATVEIAVVSIHAGEDRGDLALTGIQFVGVLSNPDDFSAIATAAAADCGPRIGS